MFFSSKIIGILKIFQRSSAKMIKLLKHWGDWGNTCPYIVLSWNSHLLGEEYNLRPLRNNVLSWQLASS